MTRRAFLSAVVVVFAIVGVLPVLYMLGQSIVTERGLTLDSYQGVLSSTRQWVLMGRSMVLSALVTLLSLGVGVPLGLLLGKTDLPLKGLFAALFVVPLLLPPYILAVSWFDLLGYKGLLGSPAGPEFTRFASKYLFGLPGCVLVLFSVYLPVPMLLTMVSLKTIDPRLEEAARLVSGWRRVLKDITLPLILPAVSLSAVIVFLLAFGEFSVPSYLRYDVFPVESFTKFSAFYDFEAATAASVPLAGVTLLVLAAEAMLFRNKTRQLRPRQADHGSTTIGLGKRRKWFLALTAVLALVLVVAPIVVLAMRAGGIGAYAEAMDRASQSLFRSLLYASIGATLLTFMGFSIGYLVWNEALWCWRCVDWLTIFLFTLPCTVTAIGLIVLWNRPWTNLVYATPAIIVLGYMAKYTALTSRISMIGLARIPSSMEEAAQTAGAGWFRRMALIVVPMAGRSLFACWLVGFIFSLRDTGITMMVYPAGHETLPVRIFTLMANGSDELIAALCMIMIAATLVPVAALWLFARAFGRAVT